MSFFKKKSQFDDDDEIEYMDDDCFYEDENYNNNDDYNDSYNVKNNKKDKSYLKKIRKKSKKKSEENYEYINDLGYDNEEIYYDNDGYEVVKNDEFSFKGVIFICLSIFYVLFLLLGAFNTSFANGYEPQIVSPTIKSERVIYNKCQKYITFLDELDDFKGLSELQDLYKTGNFQERTPVLKESLKKVNNKLEELTSSSYKIKESNYVNVEMLDMVIDLLNTEKATLTTTISFYESMAGYNSSEESLKEEQQKVIDQLQVYKNKMSNYKIRFQEIKSYELKLYD